MREKERRGSVNIENDGRKIAKGPEESLVIRFARKGNSVVSGRTKAGEKALLFRKRLSTLALR